MFFVLFAGRIHKERGGILFSVEKMSVDSRAFLMLKFECTKIYVSVNFTYYYPGAEQNLQIIFAGKEKPCGSAVWGVILWKQKLLGIRE